MNRFRVILFLALLWAGGNFIYAQVDTNLLTFDSAYQLMQKKNPSLQKAQKEIQQKEYEKDAKKGLYLPKVSVSAKAVAMANPLHLDLTDVGDAITGLYEYLGNYGVFSDVPYIDPATGVPVVNPATGEPVILDQTYSTAAVREGFSETADELAAAEWDRTIQDKYFATASADVTWPVFTGGKIRAANKAADVEVSISQEELRKTQGEMLSELVTRYYGLVLAMQASDVMKEKFEAMQKHYSDAEKMFNEGMIAKVELLSAKVALSDAQRDYNRAQRMVETVETGLSATLATEADTCFIPVSILFINKNVPNVNYWISQTQSSNPLLKQIGYKKDLTNIKTNVSKGAYLPTVALMGTYNLVDYQLSPYMPDWLIGAGLTWTLFDGLTRHNELKANKMLSEQVDFIQEKANDELKAYITKLYNELNSQLFEIKELDNTLSLAKEYCESTKKAFNEGFKSSTDVAQALSKLAQVKALRLKAFYSYDVTLATLLQASGTPEQFISYCTGDNTITEAINQ